MSAVIEMEDIHKTLRGQAVLRGATLDVQEGEALAIIGISGTGKTVFLKHMAGLMQPDKGHVRVNGKDMSGMRGRKLQQMRSGLGFLFQGGALFQSMTVYDNIAFPLREKTDKDEDEIREIVMDELEVMGLQGSQDKHPAEVSGGMAKRVALARALVQDPEIMLFDEPTTGLDPIIVKSIHDVIDSARRRLGLTAVIVTHEVPRIFSIIDRVAMLHEGQVVFIGTPTEVFQCEQEDVRRFLEGSMPPKEYMGAIDEMTALAAEEG
jgi:phospholipid/cholesterol/gamma-HCH transport system ATP-binding protein